MTHDGDELEVHADAESISTIPGKNNANRLRKNLYNFIGGDINVKVIRNKRVIK